MKNKNGFTLPEILAVVTIIGVVLLIFIPSYLNILNTANRELSKEEKKMFVDSGNTYATALKNNTDSYTDSSNNTYENYAFVEYLNSIAKRNTDGTLTATIPVTAEYLVKKGYYNENCDYNDSTKSGNCKVNKECTLNIEFEVKKVQPNESCNPSVDNCVTYYELGNYTTTIQDESKCTMK